MIAFDTDVLTEILQGNNAFVRRAFEIPTSHQALPIIVIEEVMRGRLNIIRQAEAGKSKISIDLAYKLFQDTFSDFVTLKILSYTSDAESHYQQWQREGIRISTHDLRIAAICVVHNTKLVSCNRRDFERVPGLAVEFWG